MSFRAQRWATIPLVAAAAVGALPPDSARADPPSNQLDTQLFLPTTARGSTFTIPRTDAPSHLTYEVGLGVNFGLAPIVGIDSRIDKEEVDVVSWRTQAEVLAAIGLFEWFELGVAVPVSYARMLRDPRNLGGEHTTEFNPGDLRLNLKVPLFRGELGVAARMLITLPSSKSGEQLVGSDYWTYMPSVVVSYAFWDRVTLSGELGYRMRRRAVLSNLEWDDEIHAAAGARVALVDGLSLVGETQIRVGTGGRTLASNEIPMEADFGLRWMPVRGLTIDLGGGTGVIEGYGTPAARAFTIVRYASEREGCKAGPEDFDGYEDGDFCADPDNDADGVSDELDECANDAEDADGFLDDDGCPDGDNDGDGVLDASDSCPLRSEDTDGFEDQDGCPDSDNDQDEVSDGLDECPMEPEDRDDYEDEDGCPEPGPEKASVTVTDTRILISERIYFDFDRDTIRPVSKPLLDQVAEAVKELPGNRRVRVEGYSDSKGNDEYNRDLSYRRARAVVEYLAGVGVERDRLGYVGYGEQNPVAPNDTPDGRALNRRVEFTILQPGEEMQTEAGGGDRSD